MEFKELGLTQNEAKVYETLLKSGTLPASILSQKSTVPYGRIYTVLESLEHKNLVKVLSGDSKKYIASDPTKLQEIIDSKIKNLMNINDEIKNYKKLYDEKLKESVIVAKGKSNFIKISQELSKPENTKYSIIYNFDFKPETIRESKELQKKGIEIKHLSRLDSETKGAISEQNNISSSGRIIPNEGINIEIIDGEEVMIALIKSNTTLLIRDKPFAKIMKELFIKYYIQAEPIAENK